MHCTVYCIVSIQICAARAHHRYFLPQRVAVGAIFVVNNDLSDFHLAILPKDSQRILYVISMLTLMKCPMVQSCSGQSLAGDLDVNSNINRVG